MFGKSFGESSGEEQRAGICCTTAVAKGSIRGKLAPHGIQILYRRNSLVSIILVATSNKI